MYAALGPAVSTSIEGQLDGKTATINASAGPAAVHHADRLYRQRTRQYGLIVEPDELASTILKAEPRLERIVIVRHAHYLDPTTDRIAERVTRYEYRR
jgi:hypothetical protein